VNLPELWDDGGQKTSHPLDAACSHLFSAELRSEQQTPSRPVYALTRSHTNPIGSLDGHSRYYDLNSPEPNANAANGGERHAHRFHVDHIPTKVPEYPFQDFNRNFG